MLTDALTRTLYSLTKPYFLKLLLLCAVLTLVGLAAFGVGVYWLFATSQIVAIGWLDTIIDWVATVGAYVLAWFLFPALLPLIATLFSDPLISLLEKREYKGRAFKLRGGSFFVELWYDIKFLLWVVLMR